jgi:hypothetical protein
MSNNAFKDWDEARITAHNSRIAQGRAQRLANPGVPSDVPGPQSAPVASIEPKTGGKKRIRQSSKPEMNGLEREALAWLQSQAVNDWGASYPKLVWRCQAMRFRLGNGIWYKPDIIRAIKDAQVGMGMSIYEVKGPFAFRGGFENLKVAASLYPEHDWHLIWKEDGKWLRQHILP